MRPLLLATKPVLWVGIVLVLLGLAPAATRADVVLGNINAPDGSNVKLSSSDFVAASFTMGSQAYSLSDVEIRLLGGVPSSTTFQLRDDASGHPSDNVLHTFTTPTVTATSVATVTFPAGSPFLLAPDATYWLVGSTGNGSTKWVDANPNINPSGSGANFGQYEVSSNSGGNWSNTSDTPKFQLDGTPLSVGSPEPSSLVLVGAVACVAAAFGLRHRRTRRPELAVITARSGDGT